MFAVRPRNIDTLVPAILIRLPCVRRHFDIC